MKKFMVLYMASGADFEKMMKNSTPEQQKKGMDAWMKWMNANKTSIVEGGAPLGKTKRVDSNGASNTKNEIGGYSVVQAESHDAATKIFGKDHPHLQMPGAWIEIVEICHCLGCRYKQRYRFRQLDSFDINVAAFNGLPLARLYSTFLKPCARGHFLPNARQ
jgi:hypothetical protein